MRTMIRVSFPADASNDAIQSGAMQKRLQETLEKLKPEAAYFFPYEGKRSALIVFDMKDASDMPVIAEPFFREMGANVEFCPVMNADDLRAGLERIARSQ
jgi:hypothetical protein